MVSQYVGLRLPSEMLKKIDEMAQREKNPRSAVIRRPLSTVLDSEELKNKIDSGGDDS